MLDCVLRFFPNELYIEINKIKWHPSSEYVVLQDVVLECFLDNNKILLTFDICQDMWQL